MKSSSVGVSTRMKLEDDVIWLGRERVTGKPGSSCEAVRVPPATAEDQPRAQLCGAMWQRVVPPSPPIAAVKSQVAQLGWRAVVEWFCRSAQRQSRWLVAPGGVALHAFVALGV